MTSRSHSTNDTKNVSRDEIIVVGRTGQLARALARRAPSHGLRIISLGRETIDLEQTYRIMDAVTGAVGGRPAIALINAAAYTAVDLAETNEAHAFLVNGAAPGALARAARKLNMPIVHVSTDYVFDGSKDTPYREDDSTAPLGVYGRSKLAGELDVKANSHWHAIVRTAWLYGIEGTNFLRTMLRAGSERDVLRVVDDQRGSPTDVDALADALLVVTQRLSQKPELSGTYHFCGEGETSWYGFASEILMRARRLHPQHAWAHVEPITTADYPTLTKRPAYSVLSSRKFASTFDVEIEPWQARLDDVMLRWEGRK